MLKPCAHWLVLAVLLAACKPSSTLPEASLGAIAGMTPAETVLRSQLSLQPSWQRRQATAKPPQKDSGTAPSARIKTEAVQGEFIGPAIDCDGDGIRAESRIVFAGEGVTEQCVEAPSEIPEPPFQQTYLPTTDAFNQLLPAVGWQAQYQCGDGLYSISLSRPSEDRLEYRSADGVALSSEIVYDDIDPNLNQPLVVQDPEDGLRYTFTQQLGDEFYEYAIADYSGDVGLYIYQTGEQIVAAPCQKLNS